VQQKVEYASQVVSDELPQRRRYLGCALQLTKLISEMESARAITGSGRRTPVTQPQLQVVAVCMQERCERCACKWVNQ